MLKKGAVNGIYHTISGYITEQGELDKSVPLFQKELKTSKGSYVYMPGFEENVLEKSTVPEDVSVQIDDILSTLKQYALRRDKFMENRLVQQLIKLDNQLLYFRTIINRLIEAEVAIEPNLLNLAQKFVLDSDDKNCVKFGIRLMGYCRNTSLFEEIKLIGLHEEFTASVADYIVEVSPDIEDELWELAKKVNSFGRIYIINLLRNFIISPKLKQWILFEGYKIDVFDYGLIHVHELHKALKDSKISDELFESSGYVIGRIMQDEGGYVLENYNDSLDFLKNYVRHALDKTNSLVDFYALSGIQECLKEADFNSPDVIKNGWSQEIASDIKQQVSQLLGNPECQSKVKDGLNANSLADYKMALYAANALDFEVTADSLIKNIGNFEKEYHLWLVLLDKVSESNIDAVLVLADQQILPSFDVNRRFVVWSFWEIKIKEIFMLLLKKLLLFPYKGDSVLQIALLYPDNEIIQAGLAVLAKRGRNKWPASIDKILQQLKYSAVDSSVQENVKLLLKGKLVLV